MKTEETYNVKWEKILTKLKEKSNFSELKIKAPALRITFERFKDAVLKECGISEEGANLSGLKAEASAYVQLIVSMAEEEHKRAYQAERKDKKKKTIQKGLLTHEVLALTTQGKPFINLDDPIKKAMFLRWLLLHHLHLQLLFRRIILRRLPWIRKRSHPNRRWARLS